MKILNIGTESIAFQSGAFFRDLTPIIQDARDAGTTKPEELGKYAVRLSQCIDKHTGITTTIRFIEDWDNCAVAIPALTKGHVLNGPDWAQWVEKNYNPHQFTFLDVERKGWIDPGTSRVGGAFSDIIFKTYLGIPDMIDDKYTVEESAAVILHEVGHAFTFLQFLADTTIINAVLQRAYQELTNGKPDKKVRLIISKAADEAAIENRDWLQNISDETDNEVAFRLLTTAAYIEPRAMDNKRYFSQDACEELAEIFAIRHGAGRALMTMRSKSKFNSSYSYGYLYDIAWTIAGGFACLLDPIVGGAIIASMLALMGFKAYDQITYSASVPDATSFKQTATKIRNELITQLKTSKLPKEDVRDIIESIELTDKTIQGYKGDFDRDLVMRFFDMFRRGMMDARSSREYTDKLEVLTANDLFVRAAQFAAR